MKNKITFGHLHRILEMYLRLVVGNLLLVICWYLVVFAKMRT